MSMYRNWKDERDEVCGGLTGGQRPGFERYDQEGEQRENWELVQTHVNSQARPEGEERRVAAVDQALTGLDARGHQRLVTTPGQLQNNLTAGSRSVTQSAWDIAMAMQPVLDGEDD